jgi:hypothetical protein
LLLLPACSGGASALFPSFGRSSSKSARRPALGNVSVKPTLSFPAPRPDGSAATTKRLRPMSGGTTTFTYQGYTIDADDADGYAEVYDSNGNLVAQYSWSVDPSGELTATAVGPSQTGTITMPTVSDVVGAGSVAVGGTVATLDDSYSFFTLAGNGQSVLTESVDSEGNATMTPLMFSLPSINLQVPVGTGGGGGGPGRPPRTFNAVNCAAAIIGALAIMALVADALAGVVLSGCAGGPEEAPVCAVVGMMVAFIIQQVSQMLAQLVNEACPL